MSNKAIVLDANILVRAVLGKRVREIIFSNAAAVKFFAPDVAYADARKYLPALLEKQGVQTSATMKVLDSLENIFNPLILSCTQGCKRKRFNALGCAMPMTGRCLPVQWCLGVPSGRKMLIFLERALQHGHLIALLCTSLLISLKQCA